MLQYLDRSDIINIRKILAGYNTYIEKYPNSEFKYYMIDYKLKQLGIKNGVVLPSVPKNAALLADPSTKKEPYHIMSRMIERNIADDDLRDYMNKAKAMFVQWNGQRQLFYCDDGAVVITKVNGEWIYKTAWTKYEFNDEALTILEVINKYA